MRIRLARNAHHLPVQPLSVDVRDRRHQVCCFFRGVGALLFALAREVFGVEDAPSLVVREIALELYEPGFVERDFTALDFLPGAVWVGGGDGVVDPARWDAVGAFVV